MGDFLGFTFGGVHSSDLGITRVSGGDRYDESLHPEIKDRTAEVAGLDGNYYFGTNYGVRKFSINFAFDSLTEEQFRKLRRAFNTKMPQDLIFDERPYKKYMAKIESPVELSYVCFVEPKKHVDESGEAKGVRWVEETTEVPVIDEETGEPTGETETITTRVRETIYPYIKDEGTERIYKGDGKIDFVCYFPFAKSVYKTLPSEGSEEWAVSSGLLSAEEYEGIFDIYNNGEIAIYNAGDVATGFYLYLPDAVAEAGETITYKPDGENVAAMLKINPITLVGDDNGVIVDTVNELIIGINDSVTTNTIYNQFIESGHFFKFEPNNPDDGAILTFENGDDNIIIDYDYLYF